MDILNINNILESNVINFIIMLALIWLIFKSCKLGDKLQKAVNEVKTKIDNSTNAKDKSIQELENTRKIISNIPNEIKEIEDLGEKNILQIEEKFSLESQKIIQKIKENTEKIVANKEFKIKSNLSQKTVLASIELAKKHVIKLLNEKPEYHEQFLQKSIEEINGLK